ncbi:MAG: ribokinase [Cyclobacteriaceae bacterium]
MQQLVVVGSTNMDLIVRLSHLPQPGETVGDAEFSQAHGGKGANQAVAAARAGARVGFISSVGNDLFGKSMLQEFGKDGINTDYVMQSADKASGTAFIWVDAKGENSIAVSPGANYALTPDYIDECRFMISSADLILLQLEIPFETVEYLLELARDLGKKVILNPAPARKLERKHLKQLFCLVVNETEASLISGMPVSSKEEAMAAAEALLQMGPQLVIVTLGSKGLYYLSRREKGSVEAYRVQAVDTTAAGDVFCGVLAASLLQQMKLTEAIKHANAAAALSVTRHGAQPSAPSRHEIQHFINQHEF